MGMGGTVAVAGDVAAGAAVNHLGENRLTVHQSLINRLMVHRPVRKHIHCIGTKFWHGQNHC
ncbi:hypothetical protein CEB3_c28320 [Peptococcaceae bacterium CEB3]|nr:hypothetical protein CEB3_c28320 [Peptococcaceae bacterium CEB3]